MKQFDARGKYQAPETQILSIKLGVGGRIVSAGKCAGNSQKCSHSVIITEMVRVQGIGIGGCSQAQLGVVGLGGCERCVGGVRKVWNTDGLSIIEEVWEWWMWLGAEEELDGGSSPRKWKSR
ncbi:hypothetical protein BD769DRAFT_1395325 [Suillus cothurnatus]|nr:hypothetical protein BD769DRAFT_1395325 [Suillus cothurnatus]